MQRPWVHITLTVKSKEQWQCSACFLHSYRIRLPVQENSAPHRGQVFPPHLKSLKKSPKDTSTGQSNLHNLLVGLCPKWFWTVVSWALELTIIAAQPPQLRLAVAWLHVGSAQSFGNFFLNLQGPKNSKTKLRTKVFLDALASIVPPTRGFWTYSLHCVCAAVPLNTMHAAWNTLAWTQDFCVLRITMFSLHTQSTLLLNSLIMEN